MINYTWNCKTVDVYPTEGDNTNVVYNVHYTVSGEDSDTAVIGNIIGTQMLDTSNIEDFIPFADLTNDQVVAWTKESLGADKVEAIESNIASQIAEKENPSSVTLSIEN